MLSVFKNVWQNLTYNTAMLYYTNYKQIKCHLLAEK